MNQDDENVLRFELNEQLWFQKGQELQELIGISLEPNISIQDSGEYVSVRGVIELTGEYMPSVDGKEDKQDDILNFQDRTSQNIINDVRSFEDGLNEFYYNIPVEITIPKHRITDLDDVMVEIDYFDYEIPDPSQIKLQSNVSISGIAEEEEVFTKEPQENRNETEESTTDKNSWEEMNEPFSFDVKFDEEESEASSYQSESSVVTNEEYEEERPETESYSSYEEPVTEEPQPKEEEETESDEEEKEEEKGRDLWFKKKTQSFDEFFGQNQQEEQNTEQEESSYEDSPYEEAYNESPQVEYNVDAQAESSNEESREDAGYLVNMFSHKEEDSYAKLRICIVQETDTIESIAERYETSAAQLIRYNRLEEQELNTGDILYIPVRKKQIDPSTT
ncbi:stage VI sporulation protein D [Virgibacillus sp. MSP4-1]|uniref:stage VI sporulation protein D n=1 Tax=Virgibacillus sp. MSP4-1 TaxID=2700081 RepID=UPI0003A653C9|nr:stage VI sporulation protein D [Virgibacillus sp. MSP4-1]QHS22919.1 stage VI sporulation protein D [Virgibacillus sp. MSP4-1]